MEKIKTECIYCNSKNLVKKGREKIKFSYAQIFYCKDCKRKFVDRKLSYKSYSPKIILNSLNYYNLGNTLEESTKLINKRFKVKISKSSIHSWIKEFKEFCTYLKIREDITKNYGKDILVAKSFVHNDLAYNFKYHKGKLNLYNILFPSLIPYIEKFAQGCPEFFDSIENRCSQIKINVQIKKQSKDSSISKLAELALKSCDKNSERHSAVENFMLINDDCTVASEVPIWLWEKNLGLGINGHIDILQVKNNLIYIMDFKPDAAKENEQKVSSQLYLYASGLSFRTKLPLEKFRCAWFDDKNYFEFNPKEANVKFPGSKWRSGKLEETKKNVFRESVERMERKNV